MSSHQIGDGIINSARTTVTTATTVPLGKNWVLIGPITATANITVTGNLTVFGILTTNQNLNITGNLDIR